MKRATPEEQERERVAQVADAAGVPPVVTLWILNELLPEMKSEVLSMLDRADMQRVLDVNQEFRRLALAVLENRWHTAFEETSAAIAALPWTKPGALGQATRLVFGSDAFPTGNDFWPRGFALQLESCLVRNFERDRAFVSPGDVVGNDVWTTKLIPAFGALVSERYKRASTVTYWSTLRRDSQMRITPLVISYATAVDLGSIERETWLKLLDAWVEHITAPRCITWLLLWYGKAPAPANQRSGLYRAPLRIGLAYVLLKYVLNLRVIEDGFRVSWNGIRAVDSVLRCYFGLDWGGGSHTHPTLRDAAPGSLSLTDVLQAMEDPDPYATPEPRFICWSEEARKRGL